MCLIQYSHLSHLLSFCLRNSVVPACLNITIIHSGCFCNGLGAVFCRSNIIIIIIINIIVIIIITFVLSSALLSAGQKFFFFFYYFFFFFLFFFFFFFLLLLLLLPPSSSLTSFRTASTIMYLKKAIFLGYTVCQLFCTFNSWYIECNFLCWLMGTFT